MTQSPPPQDLKCVRQALPFVWLLALQRCTGVLATGLRSRAAHGLAYYFVRGQLSWYVCTAVVALRRHRYVLILVHTRYKLLLIAAELGSYRKTTVQTEHHEINVSYIYCTTGSTVSCSWYIVSSHVQVCGHVHRIGLKDILDKIWAYLAFSMWRSSNNNVWARHYNTHILVVWWRCDRWIFIEHEAKALAPFRLLQLYPRFLGRIAYFTWH